MGNECTYGDFVFKERWFIIAQMLSGVNAIGLLEAIITYIYNGDEPDDDGPVGATFLALKPELDETRSKMMDD